MRTFIVLVGALLATPLFAANVIPVVVEGQTLELAGGPIVADSVSSPMFLGGEVLVRITGDDNVDRFVLMSPGETPLELLSEDDVLDGETSNFNTFARPYEGGFFFTRGNPENVYRVDTSGAVRVFDPATSCLDASSSTANELSAVAENGTAFIDTTVLSSFCDDAILLKLAGAAVEIALPRDGPAPGITGNDPDFSPILVDVELTSVQGDRAWLMAEIGCFDILFESPANVCPAGWPREAAYELGPQGLTLIWQRSDTVLDYPFAGQARFDTIRADARGNLVAYGDTGASVEVRPAFLAVRKADETAFRVVASLGMSVDGVPGTLVRLTAPSGIDQFERDIPRAVFDEAGDLVFVSRFEDDTAGYGCVLRATGAGVEKVLCTADPLSAPSGWTSSTNIPPDFFSASPGGRLLAVQSVLDDTGAFRTAFLTGSLDGGLELAVATGQTVDVDGEPFTLGGGAVILFRPPTVLRPGGQGDGFGLQVTDQGFALLEAGDNGRVGAFLVDLDAAPPPPPAGATFVIENPIPVEGDTLVWGREATADLRLASEDGLVGFRVDVSFDPPVEELSLTNDLGGDAVACRLTEAAGAASAFDCDLPDQLTDVGGTAALTARFRLPLRDADGTFSMSGAATVTTTAADDLPLQSSATVDVVRLPVADLSIRVDYDDSAKPHVATTSVTNLGPDEATDVVVEFTRFPDRFALEADDRCNGSTCTIPTLAVDERVRFRVAGNPKGGDLRANVSSSTDDPDLSNNSTVFEAPNCASGGAPGELYLLCLGLLLPALLRRRRARAS